MCPNLSQTHPIRCSYPEDGGTCHSLCPLQNLPHIESRWHQQRRPGNLELVLRNRVFAHANRRVARKRSSCHQHHESLRNAEAPVGIYFHLQSGRIPQRNGRTSPNGLWYLHDRSGSLGLHCYKAALHPSLSTEEVQRTLQKRQLNLREACI